MLRVEDHGDLERLARALKTAERPLRREVAKGLRNAVKPLGPLVMAAGAQPLPHSGGLRARVEKYRATPGASVSGGNPQVRLLLKKVRGYDRGYIGHPVFGRKVKHPTQRTTPGAFTAAFEKSAPLVKPFVERAVRDALAEIAKEAR